MRRSLIIATLALALALALAQSARAHAELLRSDPAVGALLQSSPSEVTLEFSEDLDPGFSRVQLYNSKNEVISAGPGAIDPTNTKIMRLALGALPKDSYTALWRARSAADGHVTEGGVPFGVGVAATATSLIPAPGAPDPAIETPPPLDAATRWLNLLLAALAFGGLPFGLLIWRPAQRAARAGGSDPALADARMTGAIRRLILVGGGLFLLANLAFLVVQAADAAGVSPAQAFGAPLVQILQGRSGLLVAVRAALAILIGALAWRLPSVERGAGRWILALTLVGALLLTFSLSAHAAAAQQGAALAVALDWLHIAAMVAWLGGLAPLAVAIRAGRREPERALPLAALIPRFSRLAIVCIALLTLSGIYSYILHINALDLLAATTYGRALLVKLGLFALLLLAGAVNFLILSPKLRAAGARLSGQFGRVVRVELVVGAALLLAVGVMTSVAPSTTAWQEHQRLGLERQATEGPVTFTLRVAPAQIGDNEFAVDVADARPGAAAAPSKVLLRFGMSGMEQMGALQTDTKQTSAQRYTARGSFTSMSGRWHVEVVLRRAGFDDVRHTFDLDIVQSAAAAQ